MSLTMPSARGKEARESESVGKSRDHWQRQSLLDDRGDNLTGAIAVEGMFWSWGRRGGRDASDQMRRPGPVRQGNKGFVSKFYGNGEEHQRWVFFQNIQKPRHPLSPKHKRMGRSVNCSSFSKSRGLRRIQHWDNYKEVPGKLIFWLGAQLLRARLCLS